LSNINIQDVSTVTENNMNSGLSTCTCVS